MADETKELKNLGDAFGQIGDELFKNQLPKSGHAFGSEIQAVARRKVAVDTSALRTSIENTVKRVGRLIFIEVGPTQKYGAEIEFGRPPGTRVNPAALKVWAKRKGLNPYAVAAGIKRKGSPAQPFMKPALDKTLILKKKFFDTAVLESIKVVFNKKNI